MRFVAHHCLQPYSVLAKPILGSGGEVLLNTGVVLKPSYIERLAQLGVAGAYIRDSLSEDLDIVSLVSDELRTQAIKYVSSIYSRVGDGRKLARQAEQDLMQTAEQIVKEIMEHGDVMLNLIDMKVYDSYTFFHCVNVTILSVVIGMGMGYNQNKLVRLAYAALLHDIGKVFIDPSIINKPGSLTDEEYETVKNHPQDGYLYIKDKFSKTITEVVAVGVLDHHERLNGSGYPSKKLGPEISDFGKVVAVADVYDALISDRPYRKGLYPLEAVEFVQGGCGTQFDYDMVTVFTQKVALFPVGSCVALSNGAVGLVMENFVGFIQRPRLKIFMQDGVRIEPYFLNLKEEAFNVTVQNIVEL